ncbi:hypothetical protein IQ260_27275 [Leptolyngbya cf. ectocarpi LEGE 11479]|uniref:Uncharacterized protein n=1 Tax=Leptolyngbya cf. ectocarpi LEGE 11479 TaxID=1828722 RepID=A0A928ZZJ5_LEPEC|nr:DUF6585 family protein [Leptolyngbya ectocarpi]MBE9070350.1 hypothetical protein [Leptolyngbya cf. ectocarpi LEGE 11479]
MPKTTYPAAELGHVIGEFGWNKKRARFLLTLHGLLLPVTLIACLFLIGIPAFFLSLWLVIRSTRRLKSSQTIVSLYEKGLIDNRNDQSLLLLYRDISKIYTSIVSGGGQTFYDYTVHTHSAKPSKFGIDIANPKQFGDAIWEGMLATQLQQHLTDLDNGASISFDRLNLSAKGLALPNQTLDWQDFGHAEIKRSKIGKRVTHRLEIYQKDQSRLWATFERNQFPNLFLFFNLVERIRQPGTA